MAEFQYSADLELNIEQFNRNAQAAEKALLSLEKSGALTSKQVEVLRTAFDRVQQRATNLTREFRQGRVTVDQMTDGVQRLTRAMSGLQQANEFKLARQNQTGRGQMNAQSDAQANKDERAIRQRELADLRADIQERWRLRQEAHKRETQEAIRSEQARVRAEQNVRQKELADLRAHIQERYRILDQKANQAKASLVREEADAAAARAKELAAMRAQFTESFGTRDIDNYVNSLGNVRYALYEVSTTLTMVSVATLGLATAGTTMAASYERAFADVERTSGATGAALGQLHDDLVALTTEMPMSFGDITDIATLGGQLGIASENIHEFTRVVGMFAATTDVTVTAAAEQLGRLAQLSKAPQSEMENLASAIYEVGVNSVATESAILGVANQIAVSGSLAGFTADQTVALAGALASLGVAPESARGSIMRIFNNIRKAVDEGGASLDLFARTASMSADEFAAAWASDPQRAFVALIDGFHNAAESGQNLLALLSDMGVKAVRDQRALQLLADNTEVYAQAIRDAESAYSSGTALADGYGIVAETVSARLQVLLETLKSLVAEGFTPMLSVVGPVIDLLQKFAEAMLWIVQTPFGGFVVSLVAGFTALVGVTALVGAGWARINAALIGFLTVTNAANRATDAASGKNLTLSGVLRQQTMEWFNNARARAANTAETLRNTTSTTANAISQRGLSGALAMTRNAAVGAAAGLRALAMSNAPLLAITAAVGALGLAFNALREHMKSASDRAREIFGDAQGLEQAIRADSAALQQGADAFRTFTVAAEEAADASGRLDNVIGSEAMGTARRVAGDWRTELERAVGTQDALARATDDATSSVREQTMALGENARQFLAESLINNEDFQELYRKAGTLGMDLGAAIDAALRQQGGGFAYVQQEIDSLLAEIDSLNDRKLQLAPGASEEWSEIEEQIDRLTQRYDALLEYQKLFAAVDAQISETASHMEMLNFVGQQFNLTASETEELADALADEMNSLASGMFDAIESQSALTESLFGLHEALAENGDEWSVYTQEGIANMEALQRAVEAAAANAAGDSAQFAANLANIFTQLESVGAGTSAELDFLRAQLVDTFNQTWGLSLDISAAKGSIYDFIDAAIAAIQTRAALEREAFAQRQAMLAEQEATFRKAFPNKTVGVIRKPQDTDSGLRDTLRVYDQQIGQLTELRKQLVTSGQQGAAAGQKIADGMKKAEKGTKKAAKKAKEAAKEIYTLVDYARDLDSISSRAFSLRFDVQTSKDETTEILQDMRDKAAESERKIRDLRQQIRDLKADLGTLAADRKVLQFQLEVAVEYGDELRAAEIRAELSENSAEAAEKQNELKDTQKDLKKEQDASTKSLKGNSKGARENRKTVLDLIGSYRNQLITLAENGASQDTLRKKSKELKEEFKRQLTQMGYNREEVDKYALAFEDFTEIIEKVPRNITVKAKGDTKPATQALNEWIEKNKNRSITVKTNASTPKVGGTVGGGTWKPSNVQVGSTGISTPKISASKVQVGSGAGGSGKMLFQSQGGAVYRARGGSMFHPGAPRGTDTVPAWLTPGEFVQRKKAVDYYGLPFMNAINSLKFPKFFSTGGFVAPQQNSGGARNSIQLVELLPHQLQQIVRAVQQSAGGIRIGNDTIARAANAANARNAARGSH